MVDLESALDELRRFSTRPPAEPVPLDRVVERAATERGRRRATWSAAGAVLALVVAGGVWAAAGDEAETIGTAGEPVSPTSTAEPQSNELLVEPATDLEPDQLVTITLPVEPAADSIVAQCASEVLDAGDPAGWCDIAQDRTSREGPGHFRFSVLRLIATNDGLVDCAERPGRCVIGVRSRGSDHVAPISFRDGLDPVQDPTLSVGDPVVTDGGAVTVTGAGFTPYAEVHITQCLLNEVEGDVEGCDGARSARVTADAGGRFVHELLAYREMFLDYEGWLACAPCVIRATAIRQAPAAVRIEVIPDGTPRRPSVQIVPAGPYRPGQLVELRGSGFQVRDDRISIGWCRFNTDDPWSEAQGVGEGFATCAYPLAPVGVDDAGGFVVGSYPMPGEPFGVTGATCEDPAARCGLAWHPSEGSLPVFITFFEMVPGG